MALIELIRNYAIGYCGIKIDVAHKCSLLTASGPLDEVDREGIHHKLLPDLRESSMLF